LKLLFLLPNGKIGLNYQLVNYFVEHNPKRTLCLGKK